jgi:hypothetical protein
MNRNSGTGTESPFLLEKAKNALAPDTVTKKYF